MRIRKQAKLRGLTLGNNNATFSQMNSLSTSPSSSSPLVESHICILNQSPWDVIDFPLQESLPSPQVDQDVSNVSNLISSSGAVNSVASMNVSVGDHEKKINDEKETEKETRRTDKKRGRKSIKDRSLKTLG